MTRLRPWLPTVFWAVVFLVAVGLIASEESAKASRVPGVIPVVVWVAPAGRRWHRRPDCPSLRNVLNPVSLTGEEAQKLKLTPCAFCSR